VFTMNGAQHPYCLRVPHCLRVPWSRGLASLLPFVAWPDARDLAHARGGATVDGGLDQREDSALQAAASRAVHCSSTTLIGSLAAEAATPIGFDPGKNPTAAVTSLRNYVNRNLIATDRIWVLAKASARQVIGRYNRNDAVDRIEQLGAV
jgi:hypothetical protein